MVFLVNSLSISIVVDKIAKIKPPSDQCGWYVRRRHGDGCLTRLLPCLCLVLSEVGSDWNAMFFSTRTTLH